MILTPTYHVFDMYKVHQNAQQLSVEFESSQYSFQDDSVPQINVSSSRTMKTGFIFRCVIWIPIPALYQLRITRNGKVKCKRGNSDG